MSLFGELEGVVGGAVGFVGDALGDVIDLISDPIGWVVDTLHDGDSSEDEEGVVVSTLSNSKKIQVIYGQRLVGGTIVFVGTSGSRNQHLNMAVAFSEGEVGQVSEVYINDVPHWDASINSYTAITKHRGSPAQSADSQLVFRHPDTWTEDHKLSEVCYVRASLLYDSEKMRSFPRISSLIFGRECFDVRDSNTAFTGNPAIVIYDYLTNAVYGKGLPTSRINTQSFIDAANYCDTQYEEHSGSGTLINFFYCDAVIDTDKPLLENLKALLKTCRGNLPYISGQYYLKIEKDETSVFTFDSSNILEGSWSFSGTPKKVKLNRVKVKFTNKERNWKQDIVSKISIGDTYYTEDNNVRLEKTINYPFETNQYRAGYLAETMLKKSREGIAASFGATLAALKVEVGDVVDITHATPGWTNKAFRVTSIKLLSSGNLGFSVMEHTSTVYDRTVPAGLPTEPDTSLPDPFTVLPPTLLAASSGTSELILGSDGTISPRVYLTWTAPDDIYVTHFEIQFKKTADTVYQDATPVLGQASEEGYITGVEDSVYYDIRIKAVNSRNISSGWLSISHRVVGKSQPPPDVNTFLVVEQSDGTRQLSWTYPSKPLDHDGYEIRYYLGTTSDWSAMEVMHQDTLKTSPWETNQLSAGTYTFAIKAVDTTGNYSTNPVFMYLGLGDPRLTALLDIISPHISAWPGTKTNCSLNERDELVADDQYTWSELG